MIDMINLLAIPAGLVEYVGYFGSFLTSITFIPQVYKSWQSKSVGDLSIWMILIVLTSSIVWLLYAFAINSGPVISANTVVLVLTLVLLYFKIRFKKS
jgi:MtN3 and saliva related transmembrane protein